MDFYYDCETFPNYYCLRLLREDGAKLAFEISEFHSDFHGMQGYFRTLASENKHRMIGFNNLGFDYPILHYILTAKSVTPESIYSFAKQIIDSQNKFAFLIKPADRIIPQIDLFKIHHFDNKSRTTSLKALEFNMRMDNISDLPVPVGTRLTYQQPPLVSEYCDHDVTATKLFADKSVEKIRYRESLMEKYPGKDWLNFSDVKIGKEYFQLRLEEAGVSCYTYGPDGRKPRQTPRPAIYLGDCVPWFVSFENEQFKRVHQHFLNTTILETKGAFDLTAHVGGLEYVFGTGGIHASVENMSFVADEEWMIYDIDVTSLYPSIAIENGYYPEHLGPMFVNIYAQLKNERLHFKKGTSENSTLKLALNGVYGESNSEFSVFFDPLFTMKITVGGQLMIVMLAEWLVQNGVFIIQANTDGITMFIRRSEKELVDQLCALWEHTTRLSLERVEYSRMFIADVNNYIAEGVDDKVKLKGRYDYECEWHQDASALVVPKVAKKVLLENAPIRETLENWPDPMDFMLRVKATKGTNLVVTRDSGPSRQFAYLSDRTQRYAVTKNGFYLFKDMPPLKNKPDRRKIAVQSGRKVTLCNNIASFDGDLDYDFYTEAVEKLVMGIQ